MNEQQRMQHHHYSECGLDNIYIRALLATDDANETIITVPYIQQLHRLIATKLLFQPTLSGQEIYFLRTEMGLTPAQLAEQLCCTVDTVQQWQQGEAMPVQQHSKFCQLARRSLEIENNADSIGAWSQSTVEPSASQPGNTHSISFQLDHSAMLTSAFDSTARAAA